MILFAAWVAGGFSVVSMEGSAAGGVRVGRLRLRRIRKRRDFRATAKAGIVWRGQALRLQARRRSLRESASVRVGYTATQRTMGNAVQRNRARRRLREAVAACAESHFVAGSDYVVLALPLCLSAPMPQLVAELQAGLAQVAPRLEGLSLGR